jgi:DNA-binding CsgD family transcriptional regulator
MLVSDGRSFAEIGAELKITRNTLKSQMSAIFRKIGVHRQAALLLMIQRLNIS